MRSHLDILFQYFESLIMHMNIIIEKPVGVIAVAGGLGN